MGAVASFDYAAWRLRYPEFSGVTQPQAEMFFAEATIYFANNGSGPCSDVAIQGVLLNMVTAHIAALAVYGGTGLPKPSDQPVGRVSSASEGSVSVSLDMGAQPGTLAWYNQTKYGAAFVAATAQYRNMHYRVAARALLGSSAFGFFRRY